MAVIEEKTLGACHVRIHDDFMAKTEEERQAILRHVAALHVKILMRAAKETA